MVKVPVRSHYRVNSGALALAGARQGIGYAILAAGPARRIWRRAGWWRCRWNCGRRLQLLAVYGHRHSASARTDLAGPDQAALDEMTPAQA